MAVGTLEVTPVIRAARHSFGSLTESGSERNRGEVDYCYYMGEAELDTAVCKESPCGKADTEDGVTAISGVDGLADRLSEDDIVNLAAVLGHEIAENTRRNYRSQWARFYRWSTDRGVSALPAGSMQVAVYLAERSEQSGNRPATLHTAASAIAYVHRASGLEDPCATPEVRKTLRSVTRKEGAAQRQAEGLTLEAFESILKTAYQPRRSRGGWLETPRQAECRGRLDIAMISLMRDGLLRVSEVAALRWEDIVEEEDGTGRLLIRRSKTDREGEGAVVFVSASTMESLSSIRNGASERDSIFGLGQRQISMRIKQAARAAGLGEGFSGHSPRIGMARDLARAGTELPRLMTAGRWRSPRMPALYTRNESVARGAVAQYYGIGGRRLESREAGTKRIGANDERPRDSEPPTCSLGERNCPSVAPSEVGCTSWEIGQHQDADCVAKYCSEVLPFARSADANWAKSAEYKAPIKAFIGALSFGVETIAKTNPCAAFCPPTSPTRYRCSGSPFASLLSCALCYIHSA